MPLTFVRPIGHERDTYLFAAQDGSCEIRCAIKHSALEHSLTNRSRVTDADRERAFDENRDRIIRIALRHVDRFRLQLRQTSKSRTSSWFEWVRTTRKTWPPLFRDVMRWPVM
jgi:hypothetical protein